MPFHIPEETGPPEELAVLSIVAGTQGRGESRSRVKRNEKRSGKSHKLINKNLTWREFEKTKPKPNTYKCCLYNLSLHTEGSNLTLSLIA